MTNTITNHTLRDGDKNLVVKVQISGDSSGDEAAVKVIDMSTYNSGTYGAPVSLSIMRIEGALESFSGQLLFDATTDVKAADIPSGDVDQDYRSFGGIPNNAGTGVTGDIMLTTIGLGTEEGSFTLWMKKKYD